MSSLLKENRFITFFRCISKTARFFLTALTLTFTFFVIHHFLYSPVISQIKNKTLLLDNMLKAKETFEIKLREFDAVAQDNKILENKFKEELLSNNALQYDIDFVLNSLHTNDVRCLKFEPIETKQKSFYKKEYYHLQAKSSFENILNFLNILETENKILKFKTIEFERKKLGLILVSAKLRFVEFLNKKDD